MPTLEEILASRYSAGADILDDVGEIDVKPAKLSPELQRKRDLGLLGVLAGGTRAPAKVGAALYEDVGKEAQAAQKAEAQQRLKLASMMQQLQRDSENRAFRQESWEQNADLRRELAGMSASNAAAASADRQSAAADRAENRNMANEDRMRTSFERTTQPQRTAIQAASSIREIAAIAAAQGRELNAQEQQALIVGVNKLLDPGSVVREGEFTRTQEGQAALARLGNKWNEFASGRKVGPQALQEIIGIVDALNAAALRELQMQGESVYNKSRERGLDADYIVGPYYRPAAGAGAPPPGAVRTKGSQAAAPAPVQTPPPTAGGPPPGAVRVKQR